MSKIAEILSKNFNHKLSFLKRYRASNGISRIYFCNKCGSEFSVYRRSKSFLDYCGEDDRVYFYELLDNNIYYNVYEREYPSCEEIVMQKVLK